jgi:hypothetical protein
MRLPEILHRHIIMGVLILSGVAVKSQVQVYGTVYDQSMQYTMRSVSVVSTSGPGTVTDSLGRYSIRLSSGDSIYFSYLGRATAKFPVSDIPPGQPFDMSLQVAVDSLPTILVRPHNYEADSLANRIEYKKVFDYGANYIDNMKSGRAGRGIGVGLDLDLLLDGKKNRRMEAFQKRLEWEEQEDYIDHKFTHALVRRVTGLQPPAIDTFMRQYRPSYEFIQSCKTEYEFFKYIKESAKFFSEVWDQDHPAKPSTGKEDE